jgi:hypothetical protein
VVSENHLFFDYVDLIPTASTGHYPLVENRHMKTFISYIKSLGILEKFRLIKSPATLSVDNRKTFFNSSSANKSPKNLSCSGV